MASQDVVSQAIRIFSFMEGNSCKRKNTDGCEISQDGNISHNLAMPIDSKASVNDIHVSDQPPAHLFLPACFCHYFPMRMRELC